MWPWQFGDLAGTETDLLWLGGYPIILLSGGLVAWLLEQRGTGVQSFAWEVDDNWEVEHIVRDRSIRVTSIEPTDTLGIDMDWTE